MKRLILLTLTVLMVVAFAVPAGAADGQKLQWTGVNYTKFLCR